MFGCALCESSRAPGETVLGRHAGRTAYGLTWLLRALQDDVFEVDAGTAVPNRCTSGLMVVSELETTAHAGLVFQPAAVAFSANARPASGRCGDASTAANSGSTSAATTSGNFLTTTVTSGSRRSPPVATACRRERRPASIRGSRPGAHPGFRPSSSAYPERYTRAFTLPSVPAIVITAPP